MKDTVVSDQYVVVVAVCICRKAKCIEIVSDIQKNMEFVCFTLSLQYWKEF
jgi:hypothetical protein